MVFVRTGAWVLAAAAVAAVVGCGSKGLPPSNIALHPVHGKVTVGSQPLTGGILRLTLVTTEKTANTEAMAEVKPDGTFEAKIVNDKFGLPVGTWKVVVDPVYVRDGKAHRVSVPAKYTAETSPLTFEVKEGDNTPTLTL